MPTKVKNEAFLDLEEAVIDRMQRVWVRSFSKLGKAIAKAVDDKDFDRAVELVQQINTAEVVSHNLQYAKVIGMSAVFLGVSRIVAPQDSQTMRDPPKDMVQKAVDQFALILTRNATLALRREGVQLISQAQRAELEKAEGGSAFSRAVRERLKKTGRGYFSLAASLHVSRMSSFGFLYEAVKQEITHYTINEVLDSKTCPICRVMHGKTFSVESGIHHATNVLNADPDSLKMVAPWPSQNARSVAQLGNVSRADLIDKGLSLPPFHPMCRGIISQSHDVKSLDTLDELGSGLIGFTAGLSAGGLAEQLFAEETEVADPDFEEYSDTGAGGE